MSWNSRHFFQKYRNSNIDNIIDSSYIKVDNRTIFNWLQNNMEIVFKTEASDKNIEKEKLRIPKNIFPATVHGLCKLILEEYKPTGSRFWIHI